jgi:hypothetical protein
MLWWVGRFVSTHDDGATRARPRRLGMANETITTTGIAAHGGARLPSVEMDSFNIELKAEGFLGDRASKAVFRDILGRW